VEPARQDLGRFLELAPKSRTAYYLQALVDLQTNKYPEALDALQQVLRITPDYLPALLAYATVSYGLGHYEQSISSASKILGAAPGYIPAAKILAGSLLKTGDVNGALKTLAPLLPRHPDDAQLLALAGDTYFRAKDYNKAMEYLDRASILDPQNAVIKTRLAAGHLAEGESDKALAALEQAASLNTSPGQADLALVTLHLQRKEFDQALQAIAALEKKLPNNPVIHNLRAAALLGKRDRAGARKALEQALAIQPTFFPAAINLARLDMADNKPDAAKKRFEAILEKDKNNAQALMALADLAAIQKQESEYVNWLERAAKADSKAIKPRTALARYYLAKKDSRKALAVANEAVSANPDSLEALNLLGATQMATGDKAASVTTFTRMAQKAPQSPGVLLALARAQIFNKELGNARVNLQQALKVKPDFLQAQETLMWVELSDSKPDAALQIARQLQTQQPRSPTGFGNEGDILLTQKKYPQAVKAYELAISKGAGSSVLIKLHRAYLLAGDAKAADQRLAAWIKQHPKDAVVRTYAAEYYTSSNRNRDAIVQYEEALKLTPESALALNNLAGLYQREKDGRALATAEKALKLAPEHPGVQDTLGWILLEQGQLPRAVELLGKAAAKVPKAGPIRYHYGAALARVGKKAEARRELEAAIATGQKFPELEDAKALLKSL
jgi:putative PEP-CTERM system TPR-repeat lipoprotein